MQDKYLAKSNTGESVQEHTDMLLENLEILKNIYPAIFKNEIIYFLLKKACLYHDIGKINSTFQKILRKEKIKDKNIPHGILSLTFLEAKELRKEIEKKLIQRNNLSEEEAKDLSQDYVKILANAIGYHHERKFDFSTEELEKEIENLKEEAKYFKYEKIEINKIKWISEKYFKINERIDEEDKSIFFLYVLIKGLLNRIDYAASAGIDISVEIKNDFLISKLDNMLYNWKKNNSNIEWNNLQKYMLKNQNKNVIAVAQTGMGKTEAGLLWIGDNKGFFTLPLKTAINAIYNRITLDILKEKDLIEKVGLLHSETMEKYLENKERENIYEELDLEKYYTLTKQLCLPLTICTLDQIFDFVYLYGGFEAKLATLSYSKIVFDEIQMYSPELISYIIKGISYVTRIGGKFAILTATLPGIIVDFLKNEGIEFEISKSFTKDNLQIRHSTEVIETLIKADDIISKYNKNKILVICNTVKEAQRIYYELKEKINEKNKVNMFHSKYIKRDRRKKEENIIKLGNKKNKDFGIWVATQVVEASLDIDFDILFTELSDLNGVLQRMGRCFRNRKLLSDVTNCYIYIGEEKKKNTGIGNIIDKEIYSFSRNLIKEKFKGKITEKEKMIYVEELYSKKKLESTEYYKKIKLNLEYIKLIQPYEKNKKEVNNIFRNIRSYTIMPRIIYEENINMIQENIEILKKEFKNMSIDEREMLKLKKIKSKIEIRDLTLSIQEYEIKDNITKLDKIILSKYEEVYIVDCRYDDEIGFRIGKKIEINKIDIFDNFI